MGLQVGRFDGCTKSGLREPGVKMRRTISPETRWW